MGSDQFNCRSYKVIIYIEAGEEETKIVNPLEHNKANEKEN